MPWPQALEPQERYLRRLMADLRAAIRNGEPLSAAMRSAGLSERDAWELFDEFNGRNAAAGYAELEWDE
jgi:molybdenum-dependent DNA-binding transcriptional regulator ModE